MSFRSGSEVTWSGVRVADMLAVLWGSSLSGWLGSVWRGDSWLRSARGPVFSSGISLCDIVTVGRVNTVRCS